MAEFHFLRPLWLLLLPVAAWVAWRVGTGRGGRDGWRAVVDKALQAYVLAEGERASQRRWPLLTAMAATVVASLALAGPTWDRLPVPAYRSDEALVVALDLSRSMDAGDVEPTRLTRAKLKLLDLLERRKGGQTALVVFTSNAFTVTPLTTDTKTITSLVNALSSEIMPSRGSLLEVGIEKAATLLRQSGTSRGQILLVTDAIASPAAFDRVGDLNGDGIVTDVLAVGTEEGAPIPNSDGSFLTDASGQVVVPQLNVDNLRRLAAAGGGRFARLSVDDSDLDRLFPNDVVGVATDTDESTHEADIWRDQGIWLTLILLPLLALAFRRGWVYVLAAGVMLPLPKAQAFEWRDLWHRPDQQGIEALERDSPEEAAELFEDPEWTAAARYRAGQFDASAAALDGIDTADAHYNRGNALARAGKLAEAVEAYDRALKLEPDHADAKYNRDLVADLLKQQQQQQQQQQQGQQNADQQTANQGEQGQQGEQSPQDQQNQPGRQGRQGQQGQSDQQGDQEQASEQLARQGSDSSSSNDADEDSSEQNARTEPQQAQSDEQTAPDDQSLQAAASPDDVEDWASEQAADQWLRRIPQDPGGLLRRKFLYQYQQLGVDQDGNRIYPGSEAEPW